MIGWHCNRVSLPSVDVLTTIVSKNIKSAECKRMMLQNPQFHLIIKVLVSGIEISKIAKLGKPSKQKKREIFQALI